MSASGLLGCFLIFISGLTWTENASAHTNYYPPTVTCNAYGGGYYSQISIYNFQTTPLNGTLVDWHDPAIDSAYCTCDFDCLPDIQSSYCNSYDNIYYGSGYSGPYVVANTGGAIGYYTSGISIKLVKLGEEFSGSTHFGIPGLGGQVGTHDGYASVTYCDRDDAGETMPYCVSMPSFSATGSVDLYAYYPSYKIHLSPTCTTPAIPAQEIPAVYVNDFSGVDTTGGVKSFTLDFINCSYQSKIRYKVDAVDGSPNPSIGLLTSIPYTGVAVQVRHTPTGYIPYPVVLGAWNERNTTASSWSVPMSVRYYKIGNVTPGPVNAKMTITTEYQ